MGSAQLSFLRAVNGFVAALIVAAGLASGARAQLSDGGLDVSQYLHSSWKIREGFVSGRILSLAQTPDGYLWLGTSGGLFRFDGVRATRWQPRASDAPLGGAINTLSIGRDGTLWIGGSNGLASLSNDQLARYPALDGRAVSGVAEDGEGTVWVGALTIPGRTGILCALSKPATVECEDHGGSWRGVVWPFTDGRGSLWVAVGTNELWRWKPNPQLSFPIKGANVIPIADRANDDAVLVATREGVLRIGADRNELWRIPGGLRSLTPTRLLWDHSGGLWIGTLEGGIVHVHDGVSDVFDVADGLSGNQVLGLLEDREGNVWVATQDGLDRFRVPAVVTYSLRQGLSNATVNSILAASDHSLWLATLDGFDRWSDNAVTLYRSGTARTRNERKESSLPNAANFFASHSVSEIFADEMPGGAATSVLDDKGGHIWIATQEGVARFDNGNFATLYRAPPRDWPQFLAEDSTGLWISYTNAGLVHIVGGEAEIFPLTRWGQKDFATTLVFDPKNSGMWLGFLDGGIGFLKDFQLRRFVGAKEGLGRGRVGQLQLDPDGTLWAATEGGLSRISDSRIATLNSANGLPCDDVLWMLRDDDGDYWLYSSCGLLRVAAADMAVWIADPQRRVGVAVFDASDGVRTQPEYFAQGSPIVAKTADGRIWFLPLDGISVIDPRHILHNALPPPVAIEQVTADGISYRASSVLRLGPLIRDLTIDYTALSLAAPEKTRFRFKLEGQDDDWREVANRRRAEYTNLEPGSYRFRVLASNNDGVWNEEGAALSFEIAAAYWQTVWFKTLIAALALALLAAAYWMRERHLAHAAAMERQRQQELAHASRLSMLGQLSASIAHEVTQPLASTLSNAHAGLRWLKAKPPELGEVAEALESIVQDVDRSTAVIDRIRAFVRKAPARRENIAIRETIEEVLVITHSEVAKHGVQLQRVFAPDLPAVAADRVQIQQVLLNLVVNGVDALIAMQGEDRKLTVGAEALSSGEVCIYVSDNGSGIDPAAMDKIFEPFHTTKQNGLGMGLAICRSIVEAHGGKLSAAANAPRGAVFRFTLPIA